MQFLYDLNLREPWLCYLHPSWGAREKTDSSHFAATATYVHTSTAAIVYLESQQAAVDLGSLNQSAAVIAADICAALIASQIDQWKFAVQRGGAVVAS